MKKISLILFAAIGMLSSCSKDGDVNFFSVNKDIELGQQLEAQIAANPAEYPVLSEASNPEAYAHIRRIRDKVLTSDDIQYKDRFEWSVKLIDQDVLNAFAAPGGYIYVYTGLINYLDSEHELAGVMGHEIAHADRRHSTDQMTKQYGLSFMLQAVSGGNPGALEQLAGSLLTLKFSRGDESEADEMSVIYLCDTDYKADGASGFFQKIIDEGGSSQPAFLSTHPSPDNRVENIQAKEVELACTGTNEDGDYAAFKASIAK